MKMYSTYDVGQKSWLTSSLWTLRLINETMSRTPHAASSTSAAVTERLCILYAAAHASRNGSISAMRQPSPIWFRMGIKRSMLTTHLGIFTSVPLSTLTKGKPARMRARMLSVSSQILGRISQSTYWDDMAATPKETGPEALAKWLHTRNHPKNIQGTYGIHSYHSLLVSGKWFTILPGSGLPDIFQRRRKKGRSWSHTGPALGKPGICPSPIDSEYFPCWWYGIMDFRGFKE